MASPTKRTNESIIRDNEECLRLRAPPHNVGNDAPCQDIYGRSSQSVRTTRGNTHLKFLSCEASNRDAPSVPRYSTSFWKEKNKIAALPSAYMSTRLSTAHKLCFRVPCAICASPYIRRWFVIITNIQKSPSRGPSPDCQPLMATSFGEERS